MRYSLKAWWKELKIMLILLKNKTSQQCGIFWKNTIIIVQMSSSTLRLTPKKMVKYTSHQHTSTKAGNTCLTLANGSWCLEERRNHYKPSTLRLAIIKCEFKALSKIWKFKIRESTLYSKVSVTEMTSKMNLVYLKRSNSFKTKSTSMLNNRNWTYKSYQTWSHSKQALRKLVVEIHYLKIYLSPLRLSHTPRAICSTQIRLKKRQNWNSTWRVRLSQRLRKPSRKWSWEDLQTCLLTAESNLIHITLNSRSYEYFKESLEIKIVKLMNIKTCID
jgi:hypothetical protein